MTESTNPFSPKSIDKVVRPFERRVDVTLEKPLDKGAELGLDAGVEHRGEKLDVSAGGFIKTSFAKAKTSVGAKFGFKW